MEKYENVYSDFEVTKTSFKPKGATAFIENNCVGSLEIQETVRNITKKCRGVVVKNRTKHGGTVEGTLKLHMKWGLYKTLFGLNSDGLKEGINSLNRDKSVHPEFTMVNEVRDEDGTVKLLAFPCCVASEGTKKSIENGATEVVEVEMKFSASVDEIGNTMYEAIVQEITDETVKTKWMTEFSTELVKVAA